MHCVSYRGCSLLVMLVHDSGRSGLVPAVELSVWLIAVGAPFSCSSHPFQWYVLVRLTLCQRSLLAVPVLVGNSTERSCEALSRPHSLGLSL